MRGGIDGEYNDPDYYADLRRNGAAGAFFVCVETRRIMLVRRSEFVESPFHWSGVGGAIGNNETPEEATSREIAEEIGYHGEYDLVSVHLHSSPTLTYQNFIAFVEQEFQPVLQWENTTYGWFTLKDMPSPLHPGIVECLNATITQQALRNRLSLNEDVAEVHHNPDNIDPALMTFREYRNVVDPDHKSHPSSAYNVDLAGLNEYFKIEKFPRILKRLRVNNLNFTVRMKMEKIERIKERRDGEIVYFSDEEMKELGWSLYDYTIAIVDEDNQCVASLQDEWGCVLVMTAKEYQGFGFGKLLLKMAYTINPSKPSGGFTESGFHTFRRIYREFVSDALQSGRYRELIQNGLLTMDRLKTIIASADLKTRPVKKQRDLNHRDPRDWLLYGNDSTFILYDRKFRDNLEDDQWGDEMIKGMIHFGIIERQDNHYGIVYSFGGSTPGIKAFLLRCAAQRCEEYKAVLMVDPDDYPFAEKFLSLGNTHSITGYERTEVFPKEDIDLNGLIAEEARFRKSFDRYDEFHNSLIERADSKYRINS